MKKKRPTNKLPSEINPLLKIAFRIGTQAQRADDQANWREKVRVILGDRKQEGTAKSDVMLRTAQIERDAGAIHPDMALAIFMGCIDRLAEKTIENDPALGRLSAKMNTIRKREGLGPADFFELHDPKTPSDWLALNRKYDQRLHEIEAMVLKAYGEDETAGLVLNDQTTLGRRMLTGLRLLNKNDPQALADLDKHEAKLKEVEKHSGKS